MFEVESLMFDVDEVKFKSRHLKHHTSNIKPYAHQKERLPKVGWLHFFKVRWSTR